MSEQQIETVGDAVLIRGDAFEVLKHLQPVDHVITDPPYSDRTHKMAKTNKGAGHGRQLVTFEALTNEQFVELAGLLLAVANGWVVATCDYRHARLVYDLPWFVRLGAWVKLNPMPQISADRPGQGFETVAILHAGVKPKAWNRGGGAAVWTTSVVNGGQVPTQKPLQLARAFVADFTAPGDCVLDPFMGAGTTGVACMELGRKFVGIEADPDHYAIARERIDVVQRQGRLL